MDKINYAGNAPGISKEVSKLEFYGGRNTVYIPLMIMVVAVLYLSLNHASLRALWVAFAGALACALLLSRNWDDFAQAAVRGLSGSLFALISLAIIFASIIASILQGGGMIESIAHYALQLQITGNTYILATFLIASLVGVSTGSAAATILAAGPILYPIGYLLGSGPAYLIGAIVSSAAFGDNMAPIGNMSIASAVTQGRGSKGRHRRKLNFNGFRPCRLSSF